MEILRERSRTVRRTGDVDAWNVGSGPAGLSEAVTGAHGLRWLVVRATAVALATLAAATFVGRADAFVYWTETAIGTTGRANLDGSGVNLTLHQRSRQTARDGD